MKTLTGKAPRRQRRSDRPSSSYDTKRVSPVLNMRQLVVYVLSVASLTMSSGCGSLHKQYAPSERPSFFGPEIRSRTWVDLDGVALRFLSATVTNLGPHREFMIVRFGDTNVNQARCLELYRINRKTEETSHDKFVLIDHDWGPREQSWWPSVVVSVEPIVRSDTVSFQITREPLPSRRIDGKRLIYYLDYRAGVGITPNISEWRTEGP